jgi:hypothetical protein
MVEIVHKECGGQGRAYVRASSGPCRCFILKLSCHSINIYVGLRELGNSLHRGVVVSFQLGLWDGVIFLGPTVVCRRLVAILDPPLAGGGETEVKFRIFN